MQTTGSNLDIDVDLDKLQQEFLSAGGPPAAVVKRVPKGTVPRVAVATTGNTAPAVASKQSSVGPQRTAKGMQCMARNV